MTKRNVFTTYGTCEQNQHIDVIRDAMRLLTHSTAGAAVCNLNADERNSIARAAVWVATRTNERVIAEAVHALLLAPIPEPVFRDLMYWVAALRYDSLGAGRRAENGDSPERIALAVLIVFGYGAGPKSYWPGFAAWVAAKEAEIARQNAAHDKWNSA